MRGQNQHPHQEGNGFELLLMLFISLILLQEMPFSPCSLVRTKFPSRVMNCLLAINQKGAGGESGTERP